MTGVAPSQAQRGFKFDRLVRFLMVGGVSTSIYAVGTVLLTRVGHGQFTPGAASVVAYLLGAAFSYTAHKAFTFRSEGAHTIAAPRFAASTGMGISLSWALAAFLTGRLGAPVEVPVALACVLVPAMNYLLLSRWVFVPSSPRLSR